MTIEEIKAGESKTLEFKVSRPEKSIKYMKSVVAFANGKGGRIVFGVDDRTTELVGISEENIFREMDAIANAVSDSCEPIIVPNIYPQTIDGKTLIIVEVSAGRQKPYYIKQEGILNGVYIRVSGTTRKADQTTTREMYYESEGRSYDMVVRRDMSVSEDEIDKLCHDMREVAIANCKNDVQRQSVKTVTKNVLLSWGFLEEDEDGSIYPTNAYVFLTGRDAFLSKIQCGMFKGKTRAIFVDKREYDGPLWQQVEEAFRFVLRNIRLGAKFEGVFRKDIYEIPPDSVRELIINAVMNCSFLQPSHIQVAIYDDRLEITSPGGLMPGVTVERMKEGYSQIRNRALAHAFSYMNLIEGWGTGIPRLLRDAEEYGLCEPEFVDMDIALRVVLRRTDAGEEMVEGTGEEMVEGTGEEMVEGTGEEMVGGTGEEIEATCAKAENINEKAGTLTGEEISEGTGEEMVGGTGEEMVGGTGEEMVGGTGEETIGDSGEELCNRTKILEEIKSNPQITQRQLANAVGLSYNGTRYIMRQLIKEGVLKRVGSTKNGWWAVHRK